MTFQLAPMDRAMRVLTFALLALPFVFVVIASTGKASLFGPAVFLVALYGWIWVRFRPTRFIVHANVLEIVWPMRRLQLPLDQITAVRVMNGCELRPEVGWAMRVGAGGLWGGFGWLWTQKRGIVQMYVSRVDGLIWIERGAERPWLITPERPIDFARALAVRARHAEVFSG
ncbi:MAG TPA: PH domain-containing protein [Myxococcales bacterium]|nr:PH domain-containing protein [Myxococcales bacterium]